LNLTFESWRGFQFLTCCASLRAITVSPGDIRRLRTLVHDRNAPQKHAWRVEIVLLTADAFYTNEITTNR